MVKFSVQVV